MSFFDELITWLAIGGLGFVAWKYKVQPELERQKKEKEQGATQQTTTVDKPKPKFVDAIFKVDEHNEQQRKD